MRAASRFQQLAVTHAAMMGGEATMVVALADSFFFDVDPSGARSRVLGFLLASFAPFLLVAPLIGPAIDRVKGGRRFVVQSVAAARIAVQVAMIWFTDSWALFPLVFVALVLAKTYAIAKSALVPSVVRTELELVEANSKLGMIAGLAGTVAVIPAAVTQLVVGSAVTLAYGAGLFALALVASLQLPSGDATTTADHIPANRPAAVDSTSLQLAWVAMLILRAGTGFMLFHLAFLYRDLDGGGKLLLGVAVGCSSLSVLLGNSLAPSLRRRLHEERMIALALAVPGVVGVVAAGLGGAHIGVAVAAAANFAAAIGRLSFESIVQRDSPAADRGRVFAQYETRFQLAWVVAAVLPVVIEMPGGLGYLLIGVVMSTACGNYVAGVRAT